MKKILLADDHSIVRSGVKSLIKESFGQIQVDEAGTEDEILRHVKQTIYDLVILDISLPNADFTGIMHQISAASPSSKLLIFSMHPEEIFGVRSLQLGAKGYLRKTASNEEIILAINRVLDGKKYINENLIELLSTPNPGKVMENPFANLSARELEIAKHLNNGVSLPDICTILKIQYSTANTFKRRIFEKLNVHSVLSLTQLMKAFDMQ